METNINKIAIMMLKKDIKEKAELQKYYKNQRKTVNLVGERKMSPSEATWKHFCNREELRRMYLAYGLLRGKELSDIDRNYEDVGGYLKIAEEYEKKAMNIIPEKVD
jgi:hypothetical protein